MVLLDRSASMGLEGGPGRSIKRSTEARAILARAGEGTQLEVATFDETVHPLANPPTCDKPRSSRRPPAPTTAPPWPGPATSWSAPGKKSRNCTSSPIFQRSGLDRGETREASDGRRGPSPRLRPRVPQERRRDGHRDRTRDPAARRVGHGHRDRVQRLAAADLEVSGPAPRRSRRRRSATWSGRSTWTGARRQPSRSRSRRCPKGSGAGTSKRQPAMN